MRTKRIYTLDIKFPIGVDHNNPPQAWLDYVQSIDTDFYEPVFHFPRRRNFLTKATAERHANYHREYGCIVEVIASEPIVWCDVKKDVVIADLGD